MAYLDGAPGGMTTTDYCELFEGVAGVSLDWNRVRASGWPVRTIVAASLESIRPWFLPWYIDAEGNAAGHADAGAEPLTFDRLWRDPDAYPSGQVTEVSALAHAFRQHRGPLQLLVGGYELGADRLLVIDGNHRLAALHDAAVPFRVLAVSLAGPLDPAVLPDLRHWGTISL